ncbi:DUF1850 domain-containing protein [Virgibacillus sp. NKC19-16]|uniref:DUF1850 domain-containing protein n=1 Tax=Virgibacillus salidurans TaxID=2831673 RepID=UPI001F301515|nr:DUF1850 domain-containing protein [Virgibacillus sp. NKC19-16]UJL45551.1 DUF1850 domain-containing protein [Virgibacillus sp. NKC19-16]
MLKKAILIFTILLIGIGVMVMPIQSGILLTDREGEPFYFLPWDSDEITIGWRHSVELTPWKETYRITDEGSLSFKSTLYQSYGAGTPDVEGEVDFLENGFIQVTDIERKIAYYSLYYVSISQYYLEENEKKYPLSQYVPENTNVQIHYEQLQTYEWLGLKLKRINKEG